MFVKMIFLVEVNENSKKDEKVTKRRKTIRRRKSNKTDGKTTECKVKRKTGKGKVRTERDGMQI